MEQPACQIPLIAVAQLNQQFRRANQKQQMASQKEEARKI
jgi:hypothetical protein